MNLVCDICGTTSPDVRPGVVSWLAPLGQRYNAVNRCTDHAACKERVLLSGEEWPILEPAERPA